jgi:hypothetical protein
VIGSLVSLVSLRVKAPSFTGNGVLVSDGTCASASTWAVSSDCVVALDELEEELEVADVELVELVELMELMELSLVEPPIVIAPANPVRAAAAPRNMLREIMCASP